MQHSTLIEAKTKITWMQQKHLKDSTPLHNKTSKKTRNRRNAPQNCKGKIKQKIKIEFTPYKLPSIIRFKTF
jgi:hypothetical protein